jgi:hypothetical protein
MLKELHKQIISIYIIIINTINIIIPIFQYQHHHHNYHHYYHHVGLTLLLGAMLRKNSISKSSAANACEQGQYSTL